MADEYEITSDLVAEVGRLKQILRERGDHIGMSYIADDLLTLRSAVDRLTPIREVWEKYKRHDSNFRNAVLTYGYNDSDVREVFHDCWQAIRTACEKEAPDA